MTLDLARIDATLDATWPAAATRTLGPWTLRDGRGGGKRVSAATARGPVDEGDITAAERAMDDAGQQALFRIRPGEKDLDRRLTGRTYLTLDPTVLYSCDVDRLASRQPEAVTGFAAWPPLEMQRDIWARGGIGPARQAIMDRVEVPKVTILGRARDKPAATCFIAVADGVAMLHALEVARPLRRIGAGRTTLIHAARWAARNGAETFTALVTCANDAANAMYRDLGMEGQPCYHYRIRP